MLSAVSAAPRADEELAAATASLYRLPRGSDVPGLARAAEFFRRLGNPQDAARTVHVAGTAGKGSVCAFVAAVLRAHGFRVGTQLSPHVRSILERVDVDGSPVAAPDFAAAVARITPVVDAMRVTPLGTPTFFEALDAVAFTEFARAAVDYAVIETGIGGLLDATNTITRPDKLGVVGRIGLDHTHLLGGTVAEIARHKAGILPTDGVGVVLRHPRPDVRATIRRIADARRCRLEVVDPRAMACTVDGSGTVLRIGGQAFRLGLQGRHQGVNAALALHGLRHLAARDGWTLDVGAVRRGLGRAWLPGRFERRVLGGRELVLDGAHSAVKLKALVDTVRDVYGGRRGVWVLAAKADKDLRAMVAAVAPMAAAVVATEIPHRPGEPAAPTMPARAVAAVARAHGLPTLAVADPGEAVLAALDIRESSRDVACAEAPVVVTGSFLHLAAAAAAVR